MMQWAEVIADKTLQDLPYKIETNRYGQIVMSPASNRHSVVQGSVLAYLFSLKTFGRAIPECSIETTEGVKVADVAWASEEFFAVRENQIAYMDAPTLCVEIRSPSNSKSELAEKKALYFQQGAKEVWICDLSGNVTFFDENGEVARSGLFPTFPKCVL